MTRNGSQMTRASFSVLDKVFQCADLPAKLAAAARSGLCQRAHVRAAAHGYLARDFESGKLHLEKAAALHPPLVMNPDVLANRLTGLTELPKTSEPLDFLADIYNHLPAALVSLSSRKKQDLGRAAVNLAFEAYHQGHYPLARQRILRAIRYQPTYLANRGVLAVLIKSLLPRAKKTPAKQRDEFMRIPIMPKLPGFYLRNQVTPYVILFIERDGSTYLSSLLISHPRD
jgi:hypothetical protein